MSSFSIRLGFFVDVEGRGSRWQMRGSASFEAEGVGWVGGRIGVDIVVF